MLPNICTANACLKEVTQHSCMWLCHNNALWTT